MSFKTLKPCRLTILRDACLAWSRLSDWNKATIGYEVLTQQGRCVMRGKNYFGGWVARSARRALKRFL